LEISNQAIDLIKAEFPQKGILILGNEERGISPRVLKRCSRLVYIPLYGRKFSLNVASAFAILAHALRQQFNRQKAF
jgi:tRNA G18 (ribose-2'-O)-methylase SpoU